MQISKNWDEIIEKSNKELEKNAQTPPSRSMII